MTRELTDKPSFEALGVTPELAEVLAAEGLEEPTSLQAALIPVLLRRNPVVALAGPGAGTLVGYGVPLLQTLDPGGHRPAGLVLCPTTAAAAASAVSLARIAAPTGHRVAALGTPWALPELASVLFADPRDLLGAVQRSRITLEGVEAVVVDGFAAMDSEARQALETVFQALPRDTRRTLLSLPLTPEAEAFARAHLRRAVHIPPRPAQPDPSELSPYRGEVRYRITGEEKLSEVLATVEEALRDEARHVLLFVSSDDEGADLADSLALRGFLSGAPGEEDRPVWISAYCADAREVLEELEDGVVVSTVSVTVPPDPESLHRRHAPPAVGVVLVRPRELPHLRETARRAGYRLVPAAEVRPARIAGEIERTLKRLEKALREEDLSPFYLALEPLFETWAPGEVAAAALALLRRKTQEGDLAGKGDLRSLGVGGGEREALRAWVRLFLSVGEKDGIGPGDLLGAITGEAGVEGSQVGKIEIRDHFSLVEVPPALAERIIRSLNGTTIRGRAVRVDFDRGTGRTRPSPPSPSPRGTSAGKPQRGRGPTPQR